MNAENIKNKPAVGEVKETAKSGAKKAPKSESKAVVKTEKPAAKADSKKATKDETKVKTKAEPKVEAAEEKKPAKRVVSRLKIKFEKEIVPALHKEMNYKSVMQVPRVLKIVVNIGLGETITNSQAQEMAMKDLTAIVGQQPVVTKAKKSIAAFKLRQGMPIGLAVTLRSDRMYDFLDKLVNVALPRSRDFQGVSAKSFDGRGNYTMGIKEQIIFPEIDYSKVDKVRGMEISIVTSARTDEEGRILLKMLGMPFETSNKVEEDKKRG